MDPDYQPKRQIFDPRFTFGDAIKIIILVGTIIAGWTNLSARIALLEQENVARTEQFNSIEKKLDLLDDKLSDLSGSEREIIQRQKDYEHSHDR